MRGWIEFLGNGWARGGRGGAENAEYGVEGPGGSSDHGGDYKSRSVGKGRVFQRRGAVAAPGGPAGGGGTPPLRFVILDGMTATPETLARIVRAEAARLGFASVRIARAEELPDGARFREWLARGYHGTMAWMARDPERRLKARLIGARSVVVAAMRYFADGPSAAPPGRGLIARYARGEDYHRVLGGALRALGGAVRAAAPGARTRACVDTSAVLEKGWAERSGIGWRGKHTNVIAEDQGSWLFLGVLLTTAELAPDAASAADRCGTCTACIDVCPTRAIVAPYVLDARRCISYLTIEHRGPIPEELRPGIGNLVFGCDLCQDVCPWNRFARPTPEKRLLPREGNAAPELIPLLTLDEAGFRARFAGTAVLRATRDGFVRNVAVALGNSGDPAAVAALTSVMENDPSPMVREHAEWAVERLRDRKGK